MATRWCQTCALLAGLVALCSGSPAQLPCAGEVCPSEADATSALQLHGHPVVTVAGGNGGDETTSTTTTTTTTSKPLECQSKMAYCQDMCKALKYSWACPYVCLFRWKGVELTLDEHCSDCCQGSTCAGAASSAESDAEEEQEEAEEELLKEILAASSGVSEEEILEEVEEALADAGEGWCSEEGWAEWCSPFCKAFSWPIKSAVSGCETKCSAKLHALRPIFRRYCEVGVCQGKGWWP